MDGQWYSYDDSSVDLIPGEEVCTRGAYILFYERRNTIPAWSAGCSVRGTLGGGGRKSPPYLHRLAARVTSVATRAEFLQLGGLGADDPSLAAACVPLGSTSSSVSDHWLVRLTGDSKRGSLVSRSSTTQPSGLPDSPESPVFLDDDHREERGLESRS